MTHHKKTVISSAQTKAKQINSEYRALVAEQIDNFCQLKEGHNELYRSGLIYDVWCCNGQVTQIEREGGRPATVGDIAYLNTFIENFKKDREREEADIAETEAMLFISER